MNIFQFAMQMEKDGENFYRELSERSDKVGLGQIFNLLANEEAKHYQIVKKMSEDQEKIFMVEERLFENVKNIFIKIKETEKDLQFDTTEAGIYRKALKIEKDSRKFYLDKANEVQEESKKQLLLRLAEEEEKHEFLMENLIEFITRPETWLENAEWNHLDEY